MNYLSPLRISSSLLLRPSASLLLGPLTKSFSPWTSLYTVIPNNESLQALTCFFNQRPIKKPSSETLLRVAELVLTLNCFPFGDNYFKQSNGVAMGTKMGPS